MNRAEKESVNTVATKVTRQANEPEDIDLAAEATEGAPAKSLRQGRRAPRKAAADSKSIRRTKGPGPEQLRAAGQVRREIDTRASVPLATPGGPRQSRR